MDLGPPAADAEGDPQVEGQGCVLSFGDGEEAGDASGRDGAGEVPLPGRYLGLGRGVEGDPAAAAETKQGRCPLLLDTAPELHFCSVSEGGLSALPHPPDQHRRWIEAELQLPAAA